MAGLNLIGQTEEKRYEKNEKNKTDVGSGKKMNKKNGKEKSREKNKRIIAKQKKIDRPEVNRLSGSQ